jgi:hypothetical protein
MCILRDLPKQKNPILYVPIEIFLFYEMGKRQGNKNESSLCKRRFRVLVHFLEVWEHPQMPLPQEIALI